MSDLASELRSAFDHGFAAPPPARIVEHEDLLAIRVRGDRFALDVREIAGVETAGLVVPLPSRSPGILGITGLRGSLVPVYSLAVLLGYPPDREVPRWLALSRAHDPLALSFGEYEGYLRIPRADLHEPEGASRKHVRRIAKDARTVRGVVSIPSVVAMIKGS